MNEKIANAPVRISASDLFTIAIARVLSGVTSSASGGKMPPTTAAMYVQLFGSDTHVLFTENLAFTIQLRIAKNAATTAAPAETISPAVSWLIPPKKDATSRMS